MPARYTGSPLAELLPVHLSSNWSVATLSDHLKNGFRPRVRPRGEQRLQPAGSGRPDQRPTTGRMGPGDQKWYWHSEQTQAKQSASVLWEISDLHEPPNPPPMPTRLPTPAQRACSRRCPLALGRVMYLASDSTTWPASGGRRQPSWTASGVRSCAGLCRATCRPAETSSASARQSPRYLAGDPVVITIRLLKEDFTPATGQAFKIVARGVTPKDPATGQIDGGPVLATADAVEIPESPGIYRATLSRHQARRHPDLSARPARGKAAGQRSRRHPKNAAVDMLSGTDREMRNVNADRNTMSPSLPRPATASPPTPAYADILAQHIPNLERPTESIQQIGLFADPENPYTRKAHWVFLAALRDADYRGVDRQEGRRVGVTLHGGPVKTPALPYAASSCGCATPAKHEKARRTGGRSSPTASGGWGHPPSKHIFRAVDTIRNPTKTRRNDVTRSPQGRY